jgi:multicomponent K+:H+ antiporter subunit F
MTIYLLTLLLAAAPAPGKDAGKSPMLAEHPITEIVQPLSPAVEALRPVLLGVIGVGFVTLLIGIGLCLYRVLQGPHLADRVVAADTLTLHLAGIAILLTMGLSTPLFFDAVLIIAIIGFASTVAFSQYISSRLDDERRRDREEAEHAAQEQAEQRSAEAEETPA